MSVQRSSGSAQTMIECHDLVRIFQGVGVEVQALQGLTLRVEASELVAVVGSSGSGKSTLMSILAAQDAPTAGSVRVAGRDLVAMRPRQRVDYRREHIGFVWQQTGQNLVAYLSAAENVALPMVLARRPKAVRARRPGELLDLLDIGDLAHRRPHEMSGGQQQRVAIAVALANEPDLLLADEPTGQLDEETSVSVLEAIRAVNRNLGVTTVIVTHDPTVMDHVGRSVQIRDGRVAGEVHRDADGSGAFGEAQEYTVIDKLGRMQMPPEYVQRLGLHDRVRLALEPDRVEVYPGHDSTRSPE